MKIFILEDDPQRIDFLWPHLMGHQTVVIDSCTKADRFKPPYDLILLDHDLGGRQLDEHEDCGLTFVKLISAQINPDAVVVVHSYNPGGALRMVQELQDHDIKALSAPFGGSEFLSVIQALKVK